MSKKQPAKCLVSACGNTEISRGLCANCYASAKRAFKNGEITERDAVLKGLIAPKSRASAWMKAAFEAMKA